MSQAETGPPGTGRRRWLLLAAVVAAAAIICLVVYLLVRDGEVSDDDAVGGHDGAPAVVADAAPDRAPPAVDLAPDRPAPRGTRRITTRELRALQRRHRALIGACYQLTARRDPATAPSRASVVVTLGDAGRVRSVAVDAGGARRLEGCLRRSVRGWRFSRSLRAQQVTFPIFFKRR
jgi:hypothetical protein